ncbi:hypothetical protein DMH17_11060 [Raoultella planticola]|nr:hypothetical protein [Raoultella planticola]
MDDFPGFNRTRRAMNFCHKAQRDIIYSCSGFMKTIKNAGSEGYFMTKRSNKRQRGWGIGLFLSADDGL